MKEKKNVVVSLFFPVFCSTALVDVVKMHSIKH